MTQALKYTPRPVLLALALNSESKAEVAQTGGVEIACNQEGQVPDWIELIPAGPVIKGNDKREWKFTYPQGVIDAFNRNGLDVVVDYEHGSEVRADLGLKAVAAGWIKELQERAGQLWGRVEWTKTAINHIKEKEYRYISPGFRFDKRTGEIVSLKSAGLTNTPNLRMTALNREQTEELKTMELEELLSALRSIYNLEETASAEDVVTAAAAARDAATETANNSQGPDLNNYVPRQTYDLAINRAQKAETALADRDKQDQDTAIETAINKAIEDGKIAPANKDHFTAMCRTKDGLKNFTDFIASAPVVVSKEERAAGQPTATDKSKLTDEEIAICRQMGIDQAAFLKQRISETEAA